MLTQQLHRIKNSSAGFDHLVFITCFWVAESILQTAFTPDLVYQSIVFALVIFLSVRLIAPALVKPAHSTSLILQQIYINAVGLLISTSILLSFGILFEWPHIEITILAKVLVFFVLGTLSPLQLPDKSPD